jgi:hypothetical protein
LLFPIVLTVEVSTSAPEGPEGNQNCMESYKSFVLLCFLLPEAHFQFSPMFACLSHCVCFDGTRSVRAGVLVIFVCYVTDAFFYFFIKKTHTQGQVVRLSSPDARLLGCPSAAIFLTCRGHRRLRAACS